MIEVRWHGRGGQGAFTAARLLGEAVAIHEHKFVQAFPSFGPERRGAPVLAFTRIDDKKVTDRSEVETCDYAVVLDDTLYGANVTNGIKDGGILVINTTKSADAFPKVGNYKLVLIDATQLALDILGRPITNVPMLAALAAAAGNVSVDSVLGAIDDQLAPRIREKNKKLFIAAYDVVKEGK
jgi:pyruvate ferredoxin oxidoreductase gamma subunit